MNLGPNDLARHLMQNGINFTLRAKLLDAGMQWQLHIDGDPGYYTGTGIETLMFRVLCLETPRKKDK